MLGTLNGFAPSGEADITWVSVEYKGVIGENDIINIFRQGVYEYEKEPYALGRWHKDKPLRREEKKWVEKPRVFDPRGRSCADPRKRFYFDPQKALAGGVIFISSLRG